MCRFVKKVFFIGLTILSSLTNASSLSCVSMNNQACKARPEIINVTVITSCFILLVLKQVDIVAIVIILMIRMRKYVFVML